MKNLFKTIIILIFLSQGFAVYDASAQVFGYKVTPKVIDYEVEPRDIISETIKITNERNFRITVYPTLNEVSMSDGDIMQAISPAHSDRSTAITSWVSIQRGGIDIDANQTVEIPITINVDRSAAPGEYHAFIGLAYGRNRPEAEAKVASGAAPGVVLRLAVADTAVEQIQLNGFLVDRFVFNPLEQSVTYNINNPGDKPVVPTGEIIFYNNRGDEVGSVKVNPDSLVVNPNEKITLTSPTAVGTVMGKYKAYLMVEYGTKQLASVYDTAFFYYIPWNQLMILLLVIFLVGALSFYLLHRKYRRPYQENAHLHLPFYVYDGESEANEHDINLKK